MSRADPQIFFHVGMPKVASTFLQRRFFPKLQGVHYIPTARYFDYDTIIARGEHTKYLISRELDRQLEREVRRFSESYSNGRAIVILRRHDGWIASQYRRFVKNGMYLSFDEFIDLEHDEGFWKIGEMTFHPVLALLEGLLGTRPLVLFHDDLRQDSLAFFDRIAETMGVTYDRAAIDLRPVHRSYSEKQLKVIRRFKLYGGEPVTARSPTQRLARRLRLLSCYAILYPAALVPEGWAPKGELIPQQSLDRVREFFTEDWKKCRAYAAADAAPG